MALQTVRLKNVLVVGGCGFLGQNIVKELLSLDEDDLKVSVLDANTERARIEQVDYYSADITLRQDVERVLDAVKPHVIFDTVSPSPFVGDRAILERVNVSGTRNLVECAIQAGTVKAFVYTSSSSIVHDQRNPMVEATEKLPVLHYPQQPEFYSHTKALAEEIVLAANRAAGHNMLTASIRPAALYGEGDGTMTTNLTKRALEGKSNVQFGDGKNLFDVCYVRNCTYAQVLVAQALVKAADSDPLPEKERVEGEPFIVTDDAHLLFWGFGRMIAEAAGHPVRDEEIRSIPKWLILPLAFILDTLYWIFTRGRKQSVLSPYVVRITTMERTLRIDKIKERLGYAPRFTTQEGVKRAVSWYVGQQTEASHNKIS